MSDDRLLVDQVVRFAFLIRLASLLLIVLTPGDAISSPVGLVAIGFITLTSTVGLYGTSILTRKVAAHPILLVVDVLAATSMAFALGIESPILLYALSTAVLIGILLPTRFALAVLAVLVAAYLLVAIEQDHALSVAGTFIVPISYATVGGLGCLTRVLLQSTVHQQRRASMLSADAARERERARLARERHDSVAKALHGISMAAAALPMWAEQKPEELPLRAKELQEAAEDAARDARSILVDLRADTDDRTLAQQLRAMSDDLTNGGVQTIFTVGGIGDCDHEIKRELVAIAAEALENVRRHSGAKHVALTCAATADVITMSIRDDGAGFDPRDTPADHFGVLGMRERAETIGAELDLTSSPGEGTTVLVRSPRTTNRGTP